jgi:hypothetical protein
MNDKEIQTERNHEPIKSVTYTVFAYGTERREV